MRFLRRHWYNVGLVVAAIAATGFFVGWHDMGVVQRLLALNFVALLIHQFEEYGWPGGFPWIHNEVVMAAKGGPGDRFPLNQNSATFINLLAWPFCLAPALFPRQRCLGLAMVLFTFGQLVFHGVVANRKLKSIYNPGLAAVVFLHVPIAIWYLVEIYSIGGVALRDWLLGGAYLALFIGVVMQLIGFKLLASKDSPYPFAPEEMARFDRTGHLARLGKTDAT